MKAPQEPVLLDLAESRAAWNQSVFTFHLIASVLRHVEMQDKTESYTVGMRDPSCNHNLVSRFRLNWYIVIDIF